MTIIEATNKASTPQAAARACAEALHRIDPEGRLGLGDVVVGHIQKLRRKEMK